MQKKRDTPSEWQLELEFDTAVEIADSEPTKPSNVVKVQFRIPRTNTLSDSKQDQALIDRILQSAQRLKW